MLYINEECWEIVVDFEEIEEIEDDIMEYVKENTNFDINSYENHKYWISCKNSTNCNIWSDIIEDKIDRLMY